jgi:hypothetical protein
MEFSANIAEMVVWSIVGASQFWMKGRSSFLTCRTLLGALQGGFIPEVPRHPTHVIIPAKENLGDPVFVLLLQAPRTLASSRFLLDCFRTSRRNGSFPRLRPSPLERLGWQGRMEMVVFGRSMTDQKSSNTCLPPQGLLTLLTGLFAFLLMPSSPTTTASWFRGSDGWFTEREEKIMVNRILREDPSKSSMHNREALTTSLLWQSIKDFDLWPMYLLGITFQTPMSAPANYLTLSLRELGFGTFQTNLLVIPKQVVHVVNMLALTYAAEVFGELTFIALIGQLWAFPFLIFINVFDINQINKWVAWGIMTALLCYPSGD